MIGLGLFSAARLGRENRVLPAGLLLTALLSATLMSATLLSASSCSIDGYCIDCFDAEGTGGTIDADFVGGDAVDGDFGDGGPPDACASSGIEQCDGLDNDCDGETDEGDLPQVGNTCGTNDGECTTGTNVCEDGAIVCGNGAVSATFELCNNLDDDCDNSVDENNPEGGLICGTNQGECQAGVQQCNSGVLSCFGETTGGTETCNGKDDDCDGNFDENITVAGNCGPSTDEGLCEFGTQTCVGGAIQCVGAVIAQIEQCDALDHDCDGNDLNGFDLVNDTQNCTGCGLVCDEPNAFMQCNNGCEIAVCFDDFFDNDPAIPGCEFGPCTFNGAEICNGEDDDCDGTTDENVLIPDICDPDGECNGTVATCDSGLGAIVCTYPSTVTTDGSGNIVSEDADDCDELDNDCDGRTDEFYSNKGAACDDGEIGLCRDTGIFVCNGTFNGLDCTAVDTVNPGNAPPETCNNIDDDCDGTVDDGDLQEWVSINGGIEVMKYEASRPDSTATEQGFVVNAAVCSEAGRIPWTNITQPEAEAACALLGGGARLCTEAEWQNACETDNIGPGVEGDDDLMVFEAEETTIVTNVPGSDESWTESTDPAGFSGTGAMVVPEGQTETFNQTDLADSPRLVFDVDFQQTGTHYLWVRMLTESGGANSFWFAFNDTDDSLAGNALVGQGGNHDEWFWNSTFSDNTTRISFNVTDTAGTNTLAFYNRENSTHIDKIIVTTDINFVPQGQGGADQCEWSYATDCRTYAGDTCNGEDFDPDGDGTNGDQDEVLATGEMAACFAEWGAEDAFDLSGNVKEWTAARSGGVNPIRGGSFNNTEVGISCQFDFLTAGDTFFLPNIGFRCCR